MVDLWCQQIILHEKAFRDVPPKLKDQVAERLKQMGQKDLINS